MSPLRNRDSPCIISGPFLSLQTVWLVRLTFTDMHMYLAAAFAVSVARVGGSSVVRRLSVHCSPWCSVSSLSLLLPLTGSDHPDLYYLEMEEHTLTMVSSMTTETVW